MHACWRAGREWRGARAGTGKDSNANRYGSDFHVTASLTVCLPRGFFASPSG